MQTKERNTLFTEIQQLMQALGNDYRALCKSYTATDAEAILKDIIAQHEGFVRAFLQSQPAEDEGMKDIADKMRVYIQLTQPYMDDLAKPMKDPSKELKPVKAKCAEVDAWIQKTVGAITPASTNDTKNKAEMLAGGSGTAPLPAISSPDNVKTDGAAIDAFLNIQPLTSPDDNLFVDILISKLGVNSPIVAQTKALFNEVIDPGVTDQSIPVLIDSWQQVINIFSGQFDANSVGNLQAMIGFIELQSLLESLYDQLLLNLAQTSGESLDSRILSIY